MLGSPHFVVSSSPCVLADLRRQSGWSEEELASRAGVSRAAVSSIETGSVTPSVQVVLSVARVFGRSVEEIFGDERSSQRTAQWAWAPPALG